MSQTAPERVGRTPRALMFQGTGSDVGKSTLVAGLCRALVRRGLSVRPFKPQNMSNNAAATPDGGEIGRAQAVQARACGVPLSVDMNPVLLKPESDTGSQIILRGRPLGRSTARDYQMLKPLLRDVVLTSFGRLAAVADIVLVEGAGSASEVNLRLADIANMGFAEMADVPVVLVGDIDRGGVIASLVGTHAVLSEADRAHVVGFVVNKFRGDPSLFDTGLRAIADHTGWRSFGVVPFLPSATHLPAEDSVALDGGMRSSGRGIRIAVPVISRIANFDDADPLRLEPDVELIMVPPGRPLPGDADLIILPGSKSTRGDLDFFRAQGWDIDLAAHVRRGGRVLGLCGGYQMLGRVVADPDGSEGAAGVTAGLGLLEVDTVLTGTKSVRPVSGRHLRSGESFAGYEIHIGRTSGADCDRPMVMLEDGTADGATSADGRVMGTYVHGLFASNAFRHAFLAGVRPRRASNLDYAATVEAALDSIADTLEATLDIDGLLAAARPIDLRRIDTRPAAGQR